VLSKIGLSVWVILRVPFVLGALYSGVTALFTLFVGRVLDCILGFDHLETLGRRGDTMSGERQRSYRYIRY